MVCVGFTYLLFVAASAILATLEAKATASESRDIADLIVILLSPILRLSDTLVSYQRRWVLEYHQ